jgi:ERCC4-type nuclease
MKFRRPGKPKRAARARDRASSIVATGRAAALPGAKRTARDAGDHDRPIYIDDRAGSGLDRTRDSTGCLADYPPLDRLATVTRLAAGDVCFAGNGPAGRVVVGVEVKSVADLMSSVATGRLQDTQLRPLLEGHQVSWLLVYGDYRPAGDDGHRLEVWHSRASRWVRGKFGSSDDARPIPYTYLEDRAVFDLTAVGVHVKQVHDLREAAVWVAALHRWWSQPWEAHKGLHVVDTTQERSLLPGMTKSELKVLRLVMKLPGIGLDRARAVMRHFPTVLSMMTADANEWREVPGVGETISKDLVRFVRERY